MCKVARGRMSIIEKSTDEGMEKEAIEAEFYIP